MSWLLADEAEEDRLYGRALEREPRAAVTEYLVGLDLGQVHDYTAVAVAETVEPVNDAPRAYAVRHLERVRGKPYPDIVKRVCDLLAASPLNGGHTSLVCDATGVGRPVVDLLRQAGLGPIAVTITGGDVVSDEGSDYRVPKRDLVGAIQVLLQSRRLHVAERIPEAGLLVAELQNFQVKITAAANDTYGAWREGTHDDLVLAVALACWWGERPRAHALWF